MPTEEEFLAGADTTPPALEPPPAVQADLPQPEAQAQVEGDPTEESVAPAEGDADKPGEGDKPKNTPWFQTRINELTRQRYEEQRKAEQAQRERDQFEAEITRLRQAAQSTEPAPDDRRTPQQPPGLTQVDVERQANEIAARREFDASCNQIFEAGTKEHADFGEALGNFKLLGGIPPNLIEAAMETGKAADVLYELGKNPDEASRILQMSPTRMAVAVARLANKPAPAPLAPAPVSKAPAPIKPIGGGQSKVETDPDKMPICQTAWKRDPRSAPNRDPWCAAA